MKQNDALDKPTLGSKALNKQVDTSDEFVWTTKEGVKIPVSKMETSHIKNCLRMLNKTLSERPQYMPYMGDSDYAEDWVESEERHNEDLAEEISYAIEQLDKELEKRYDR